MPFDDKDLRVLVLKYLRAHVESPDPQFATTNDQGTGLFDTVRRDQPGIDERTLEKVYAIFHELVLQNVIVPGSPDRPYTWPHFRITDYGRRLVERPIDAIVEPSAYIDELCARAPTINSAVVFYARQAVRCVRSGNPTPAAVLLGCACELMLRDFTESIIKAQPTDSAQRQLTHQLSMASDIGSLYRQIWPSVEPRLVLCPKNLRDQVDRELEERISVSYHLVRRLRDDKGAPVVCDFAEDEIYSTLLRFPSDAELLYGIMVFLRMDPLHQAQSQAEGTGQS